MAYFVAENKDKYSIIRATSEKLDMQTAPELRSELVLQAGSNVTNIILDLTECHYCDTTGLGAIQIAHRLCGRNGNLILAGVSEEVSRMLSIQRFEPELVIAQNIEEGEENMQKILSK